MSKRYFYMLLLNFNCTLKRALTARGTHQKLPMWVTGETCLFVSIKHMHSFYYSKWQYVLSRFQWFPKFLSFHLIVTLRRKRAIKQFVSFFFFFPFVEECFKYFWCYVDFLWRFWTFWDILLNFLWCFVMYFIYLSFIFYLGERFVRKFY